MSSTHTNYSRGVRAELSNQRMLDTFLRLVLADQKLLKAIANSPKAKEIYKLKPELEEPSKLAVAYRNAIHGLWGAKKDAGATGANPGLAKLPRDVVKMIAERTEEATQSDFKKKK